MAITKFPPNTIWLGGPRQEENTLAVSEEVLPGMLVERFNNSGVIRYRKHASAGGDAVRAVATEQSMLNLGVDDPYAAGDLAEISVLGRGATAWMRIPSGQAIVAGQFLQSDGGGKLIAHSSTNVRLFQALENKDNGAGPGDAFLRVESV